MPTMVIFERRMKMSDKKAEEKQKAAPSKKEEKLEPCTTSHSAEASRPDEEEDACDEGVN